MKKAKNDKDYEIAKEKNGIARAQLAETTRHHKETEKNGGTGGKKKQTYAPLQFFGPYGKSRQYDMNRNDEILKAWGEYKRHGLYKGDEEKEPDTPEKMRNYMISHQGEWSRSYIEGEGGRSSGLEYPHSFSLTGNQGGKRGFKL